MSTIEPVHGWSDDRRYLSLTWQSITAGDECLSIPKSMVEKSVQVIGMFGGARVKLLGSNDGDNFSPLHDSQGIEIEINSGGVVAAAEITRAIRPSVIGGNDDTSLTVIVFGRAA